MAWIRGAQFRTEEDSKARQASHHVAVAHTMNCPQASLTMRNVCGATLASLRVVGHVLLRSLLSVIVAVATAVFYSLLAVFTGGRTHIAVTWAIASVLAQSLLCCCVVPLTALNMRRRCVRISGYSPLLRICARRLMKLLLPTLVLAFSFDAIANFVIIMYVPLPWQRYRLGMYASAIVTVVLGELTARFEHRLVRRNTAQRLVAHLNKQTKVPVHQSRAVMRLNLLVSVAGLIVIVLAHALSTFSIQSQAEVTVVAVMSVVCKLLFQHLVHRYGPRQTRSAVLATVAPTVLVETQVRMMLQRVQNIGNSVVGILVMVGVEVLFRLASLCLLLWRLQQRRPGRSRRVMVMPAAHEPTSWSIERERVLQQHAVKLHADISSEYIAMACAYAIAYFWSDNPVIRLTNASSSGTTVVLGLLQLVVEVLVDWFCCTIECWHGVDFSQIQQNSVDVVLFTVYITIISTGIPFFLYAVIPQ